MAFLIVPLESYQLFLLQLRGWDLGSRQSDFIDDSPTFLGCWRTFCRELCYCSLVVSLAPRLRRYYLPAVEAKVLVRARPYHFATTGGLPHRNSSLLFIRGAYANLQYREVGRGDAALPPLLPEPLYLEQCLALSCEKLRPSHYLCRHFIGLMRFQASGVRCDYGLLLLLSIVAVALQQFLSHGDTHLSEFVEHSERLLLLLEFSLKLLHLQWLEIH